MKNKLVLGLLLLLISCTTKTSNAIVVLENNEINNQAVAQLDTPERALVLWYLYAYGNECDGTTSKIKCKLLDEIGISNECDAKHLSILLQWFSTDMLAVYKLNKCPSMGVKSAIQNEFKKIILHRNKDTLSIDYKVKGMNNSQEKYWNIEKTDSYIIRGKTLVKQ